MKAITSSSDIQHKEYLIQRTRQFWGKVNVKGQDDCWEWSGKSTKGGKRPYGLFSWDGRYLGTHRIAYQISFGEIPEGMLVCHKCDNAKCVNPNHLFLGTYKDNTQDSIRKGRFHFAQGGMLAPRRTLDISDVNRIRVLLSQNTISQRAIGELFGVKAAAVSKIKLNQRWVA